jgi:DNA-directed RNA polymerase subunit N (RpoN/RPB10)
MHGKSRLQRGLKRGQRPIEVMAMMGGRPRNPQAAKAVAGSGHGVAGCFRRSVLDHGTPAAYRLHQRKAGKLHQRQPDRFMDGLGVKRICEQRLRTRHPEISFMDLRPDFGAAFAATSLPFRDMRAPAFPFSI